MIYLDSAATTSIDPEVLDAMMPYLTENYGNAGSRYELGRIAKSAIDVAREHVALLINANPEQIIFTSGGSEANNSVFEGVERQLKSSNRTHIVSTKSEHDSVLRAIERLCTKPEFDHVILPVFKDNMQGERGSVDINTLKQWLEADQKVGLVSVMYVNNETGVTNPINEIGKLCKEHEILFHTDCVQASSTHKIDVKEIGCDFLSISGHKIYAPKGIGALFVKNKEGLDPLIIGGHYQEFGMRGGTENVASIVGFGKACELMRESLHDIDVRVSVLKQLFYNEIKKAFSTEDIIKLNSNIFEHGKILNLCVEGVDAETLVLLLDSVGVCISAGSACRSHKASPSETLLDMGLSTDEALSSVRISFSKNNTEEEILDAAQSFIGCVKLLRREGALDLI